MKYYCSLAQGSDGSSLRIRSGVWMDDDGNAYVEYELDISKAEMNGRHAARIGKRIYRTRTERSSSRICRRYMIEL